MPSFLDTLDLSSFWRLRQKKGLWHTDKLIATAEQELRSILWLAAISMDNQERSDLAAKAKAQQDLINLLKAQKEQGPWLLLPPGLLSSDWK